MTIYKELWETNEARINDEATQGWRVHTYGVVIRDDEVITYALMVRTEAHDKPT